MSAGSTGSRRTQPSQRVAEASERARTPPLLSAVGLDGWTVTRAIAMLPGRRSSASVLFSYGVSQLLRLLQRVVDGGRPGNRGGELLRYRRAQVLKLGDIDVLDAGVWHRINGGMVDIGMGDRIEGQLCKRSGDLLIIGYLIGGCAGARRDVVPAELVPHELDVVLGGRP